MNVLSLFDGMSCGQIALNKSCISYNNYFASEIDKYSIKVTQHNYPNTIQLGDITKIKSIDLPNIDLLMGGSPCQGFSFAGKQLNFEDERSKLFFEFVRLLKECKPKYFLFENVLMKKEYEEVITKYIGVNPIMINSSLVSAQNRKRLYWTNISDIKQPEDKLITWKDIKYNDTDTIKYRYTEKSIKFLNEYLKYNKINLEIKIIFEPSKLKKYGLIEIISDNQYLASMRGRYLINKKRQDYKQKITGLTKQYIEFRPDEKTNTLTTVQKDNVIVPFKLSKGIPVEEFFYRFLTPLECERLQTVPDNYTSIVSNNQRYKMLGNGWTINVISHILNGIK
jgi:DNA-cytosine methyltransferase